jgi:hypothetical protein
MLILVWATDLNNLLFYIGLILTTILLINEPTIQIIWNSYRQYLESKY